MKRRLAVAADPHQVRVALLEDGRLAELAVEPSGDRTLVGDIYLGRVERVVPGIQAAFVELGLERHAFLYLDDLAPASRTEPADTPPAIEHLLQQGQSVAVQVAQDPHRGKGARVTTRLSLAGAYLVLLVGEEGVAVSRRIEEEEERLRLREAAGGLDAQGSGLILRTAAAGRDREDLAADLADLTARWKEVRERLQGARPPARVHRDLDPAVRAARDLLARDLDAILVAGEEVHDAIRAFLDARGSGLAERVRLHAGEDLFRELGLDEKIEAALRPRVWLPSGGTLVIQSTEALVAIDVNTGRNLGGDDPEATIRQTNLEAATEIGRQLRLRDLGGLIVIDFIDMAADESRRQVLGALEASLAEDRARVRLTGFSEFGLVEITRQRQTSRLDQRLRQPCPCCRGQGKVVSDWALGMQTRRAVLATRRRSPGRALRVRAHPDAVRALEALPEVLGELRERVEEGLSLVADDTLERGSIEVGPT